MQRTKNLCILTSESSFHSVSLFKTAVNLLTLLKRKLLFFKYCCWQVKSAKLTTKFEELKPGHVEGSEKMSQLKREETSKYSFIEKLKKM